jgi:hypothetical protein
MNGCKWQFFVKVTFVWGEMNGWMEENDQWEMIDRRVKEMSRSFRYRNVAMMERMVVEMEIMHECICTI